MNKLDFTEKVINEISCSKWDMFVEKYFGADVGSYSIVECESLINGSRFAYIPDGKLTEYEEKEINDIKENGEFTNCCTYAIMNYFVKQGLMKSDVEYHIEAYW